MIDSIELSELAMMADEYAAGLIEDNPKAVESLAELKILRDKKFAELVNEHFGVEE